MKDFTIGITLCIIIFVCLSIPVEAWGILPFATLGVIALLGLTIWRMSNRKWEALEKIHNASLQAGLEAQGEEWVKEVHLGTLQTYNSLTAHSAQLVQTALQLGATLHQTHKGTYAVLPSGQAAPLTEVQEAYWREIDPNI